MTRRVLACGLMLAIALLPLAAVVLASDDAKSADAKSDGGEKDAAVGEAPAEKGAPGQTEGGASREESLAVGQETISRRYKRFEDTLYKIAEALRKTDPDRADLLLRAIGKSKEDRISQQMVDLVQLLKENKQLGDAIDRQGDVVTQLHALLDLLLSEDRQKELKEEQARIKKYIEEVNRVIAKEKANRADNERGAPADEVAGQQKKIAEQTGNLGKQMAKDDLAKQAKAQSKSPGRQSSNRGEGQPKEGKSDDGKSDDEKERKSGESKEGQPDGDHPKEGKDSKDGKDGKPSDAKPGEDKPSDGKPSEGKPGEGEPQPGPGEGQPKEGQPKEGQPKEGQPKEGQPKEVQPAEGQPGEGQPSEGSPSEGQPDQKPQTPGREELEKAKRDMERAIEELKKKQRHAASDAQDDALANLQKAKEKLEEILRQLREEERERFLAMLEARFQRMLAMQLVVYDGTIKLDKTPESDRSSRHSARSLQLARQEEEIALEASKAIMLLREEGTAVAFPEAVEQMRDDMRIVVSRLERTDVAELTQAIEREIIEALEEMIDALQKEMEKNKDKKKDEPKEAQEGDPPLVDQLAELKMLRTLQLRINHRTKRLGRLVEGEQAEAQDIVNQLQNLADRQARIQKATYDMATGRNK